MSKYTSIYTFFLIKTFQSNVRTSLCYIPSAVPAGTAEGI